MGELIKILRQYNIKVAYEIEENDRQFIALLQMTKTGIDTNFLIHSVIMNSLICYQLSSKGEDYWEEFSEYIITNHKKHLINNQELKNLFITFLKQSKGNKRLLNIKIKRLEKIGKFISEIKGKEEFYYNNLGEFQCILSKIMKQNKNDKTILFTIKMFHYIGRIVFSYKSKISYDIGIPLDSRVMRIEKIYNKKNIDSQLFWKKISQKISIPCIHLDAILWVKCNDFTCELK